MKKLSSYYNFLVAFMVMSCLFISCSKDDGGKGDKEKADKTVLNMPWVDSEPLTSSTSSIDFWKFSSPYTKDGSFHVCAIQNGNVEDLGSQSYKLADNNGTAATLDIDLKNKINKDSSYDIYVISGNYSIFSGNIWSTVPLERKDNPTFFYNRRNVSGPFTADAQICGVVESIYIINKSGNSIKFVQKPFITDEKWYYTKAEVNLLDGSIRNGKTETEPEAQSYTVDAHSDGQSFRISSSYVPNGKKIHNARLQAEIDGKIYTTENTISSELDLQLGHAYGMVVIWDGEKLRFDESGVTPDVHIYSNEDNYDTTVEEIREDGTVVLSGKETDIPEKGEIIYSDVTTVAPYGFLYKVESVEKEGDKTLIHTSPASLGELLPDQNFKAPMLLYDDQSSSGTKRRVKMKKESEDDGVTVIDADEEKTIELFKKTFTTPFKSGDKEYGKSEFTCGVKFIGDFVLENHGITIEKLGIEAGLAVYLKYFIELALKKQWSVPFGKLPNLVTIAVPTPIPGVAIPISVDALISLSVTPDNLNSMNELRDMLSNTSLDSNVSAYIKWTPLDKEIYFKGKVGYTRIPDDNGKNCYAKFESNFPTSKDELWEFLKEMLFQLSDVELGVKGSVKLGAEMELKFKPFDTDLASVSLKLIPYVNVNGEIVFAYKYSTGSFSDDFSFKDDFNLSVGADVKAEASVRWKDDYKTYTTPGGNIFDRKVLSGSPLFAQYYDMSVVPTENALKAGYVQLKVKRNPNAFFSSFFPEEDFGFCFARTDIKPKQWEYMSLKSTYGDINSTFLMSAEFPTSGFMAGKTYEVRPYTKVRSLGYIRRPGGKFSMGSSKSDGTGQEIPDVPGFDL